MIRQTALIAVLALLGSIASAEARSLRVLVTTVDDTIFSVRPDPEYYQRRLFFVRTADCHQDFKDEEPAVLVLDDDRDTAHLVFPGGDVCSITNASGDRGTV
jgi:hypothetical protein